MHNSGDSSLLAQLRAKGLAHWVWVLALTAIGVWIGHQISERHLWTDVRYRIYQETFALTRVRGPLYPKRTALVLTQDDEYWKGELAGRAPIRRDYLARLVEKLDAADAAVIALDFDRRSPVPDGSLVEHPAYLEETSRLREAVKAVAARRPVVLPAAVGFDPDGAYLEPSSIFHGFDLGAGEPVANAQLEFSGAGATRPVVVATDAEGDFRVPNFQSGVYDVRVSAPGFQPHQQRGLEIRPDAASKPVSLSFELRK